MKLEDVRQGYANLYAKMQILPSRYSQAGKIARWLIAHKDRYMIAETIGVPWYFAAVLHVREAPAGKDGFPVFTAYLGNGQRLNAVTTIVPIGRGPFKTFEEGVIDALTLMGYSGLKDWSIPAMLWRFECFNGLGYFGKQTNSPYLWSWSNLYSRGKYDRDGHFNATLVDQQPGAAVMLNIIMGILGGMLKGTIEKPETPPVPASADTVTTPTANVLIHDCIIAAGAVIGWLGWEHAKDLYDAITNSTLFAGVIVSGLGVLLQRSGIMSANAATMKFLDGIAKKLAELQPPAQPTSDGGKNALQAAFPYDPWTGEPVQAAVPPAASSGAGTPQPAMPHDWTGGPAKQ